MNGLSTHILDTSSGTPAAHVHIELFRDSTRLKQCQTNADGRTDDPLIASGALVAGIYELHFHAGDYFREMDRIDDLIPFLDIVVIRFGINAIDQHYHVPLLLSPFGYSTYRGS